MKHHLLLAASLAVVSLAGCKKEAEPVATATSDVAAMDTGAPVAADPAQTPGQAFANVAAASDAFEIEASRLAGTKATAAKVKTFAEQMVKAHTDSTAKLKAAAAQASPPITPTATLTAAQQAQLDSLKSKSGAEFDSAYIDAQVTAHQSTLDSLKGYAAGGDVPALKDFAAQMVPIVTAHLNMAKAL